MKFGDQSLFDGAPDYAVLAISANGIITHYSKDEPFHFCLNTPYRGWVDLAMREPESPKPMWTKADQEKGILPTVGCLCIEGMYPEEVIAVTSKYIVTKTKTDGVCTTSIETFKRTYRPIETPREKYDRERDEWVNSLRNKLPPLNMSFINGMIKAYEELKPFTGDDHD